MSYRVYINTITKNMRLQKRNTLSAIKIRVVNYLGIHTASIKKQYNLSDMRKKEVWLSLINKIVRDKLKKISTPIVYDKEIYLLYSGGIGSCLAAYLLKKNNCNFNLYFNDTKTEDVDLYRFLQETKEYFNCNFIDDSDGRDIFQVFLDNKYFGNNRVDLCSRILKRERSTNFRKTLDANKYCFANGIDIWEKHRLDKAIAHWEPYQLFSPLIDAQIYDKNVLWDLFYLETGIEKPYLYTIGMIHNNCGGFCVKAGLAHYRNLLEKDKVRYLYFEKKENETYEKLGKKHPFLYRTEKGNRIYMTLEDYRKYLETTDKKFLTDDDKFSFGGCMACAI